MKCFHCDYKVLVWRPPVTTILFLLFAVFLLSTFFAYYAPPLKEKTVLTGDIYVSGYERTNSELCPLLGANLQVIILVTSAPSHFEERCAIRTTWGRYKTQTDISIAFVLGSLPDFLRDLINIEDKMYGDIIIGRFVDSYSNLTLKSLSLLEWVDKYCPLVPKVLKTDDDMFINVPKLLEFVKTPSQANATKTIWGKINKRAWPNRSPHSQFYVPAQQFPDKFYPDFSRGASYLLTTDMIRDMLVLAPSEPYLRMEDVFITGVLASKLMIQRKNAEELNAHDISNLCEINERISVLTLHVHEQFHCWRILQDTSVKCASSILKANVLILISIMLRFFFN